MNLLTFAIGAILVSNIVLVQFLGICPFMGVSKNSDSAIGMGAAVTFVVLASSVITYFLQHLVLEPLGIEYMQLISFILVIAAFVQFVEMFLKKFSPSLYKSLGVYLPLITTNCVVLFVAQDNISKGYNLLQTVVNALAVPIGFTLVLYIFSCIRVRLDASNTPKSFKGNPVAFVVAGIMALALSGLAGLV